MGSVKRRKHFAAGRSHLKGMKNKRASRKPKGEGAKSSPHWLRREAPITICANWKTRLETALRGILEFCVTRGDDEAVTKAISADARIFMELVEKSGVLTEASLLIALPDPEDLEMIKLGCWTSVYLRALFTDWTEADQWVKAAVKWTTEMGTPIARLFDRCGVVCLHDSPANVLEFRVIRC